MTVAVHRTDEAREKVLADLKSRMSKKIVYLMRRRIVAPDRLDAVMLEHYQWIIALEKQGRVLASGPVTERGGGPGVGMSVFRCQSFEEAEALAATDPFCVSGAAEFEIASWQINEGRLNVSIDLSDGSFRFD